MDCSLIIPTYNRPQLLEDILRFVAGTASGIRVFVADSSEPSIQERNRSICAEKDIHATHLSYDPNIKMMEKLQDACNHVETPYLSLCADDDLVFLDTIWSCVRFLQENKDFVLCHGDYYSCFYDDGKSPSYRIDTVPRVIGYDTPEERLLSILTKYNYLFYAVCRTDAYRSMLGRIGTLHSAHFIELLSAVDLVLDGKVGHVPEPYIVRNSSVPSVFADQLTDPNLAMGQSARQFFEDYVGFRDRVLEHLRAVSPHLGPAQAEQVADTGFLLYLRRIFASATVLGSLQEQGLIGGPCHDELFAVVHDRSTPSLDPHSRERLAGRLASAHGRGWPRGMSC